jgi:gliding motility-associated GldN-like protein
MPPPPLFYLYQNTKELITNSLQKVKRKLKVYHGSNFEKFVSKQSILDQFEIDSNQAVWEFDDHERVLTLDKETIRKVFNIKEDWPSIGI